MKNSGCPQRSAVSLDPAARPATSRTSRSRRSTSPRRPWRPRASCSRASRGGRPARRSRRAARPRAPGSADPSRTEDVEQQRRPRPSSSSCGRDRPLEHHRRERGWRRRAGPSRCWPSSSACTLTEQETSFGPTVCVRAGPAGATRASARSRDHIACLLMARRQPYGVDRAGGRSHDHESLTYVEAGRADLTAGFEDERNLRLRRRRRSGPNARCRRQRRGSRVPGLCRTIEGVGHGNGRPPRSEQGRYRCLVPRGPCRWWRSRDGRSAAPVGPQEALDLAVAGGHLDVTPASCRHVERTSWPLLSPSRPGRRATPARRRAPKPIAFGIPDRGAQRLGGRTIGPRSSAQNVSAGAEVPK